MPEFVFGLIKDFFDIPSQSVEPCDEARRKGSFVGEEIVEKTTGRVLIANPSEHARRYLGTHELIADDPGVAGIAAVKVEITLKLQGTVGFFERDNIHPVPLLPAVPQIVTKDGGVIDMNHLGCFWLPHSHGCSRKFA